MSSTGKKHWKKREHPSEKNENAEKSIIYFLEMHLGAREYTIQKCFENAAAPDKCIHGAVFQAPNKDCPLSPTL